jgi:glycosyltransferase involved in cell wall biosynthesis
MAARRRARAPVRLRSFLVLATALLAVAHRVARPRALPRWGFHGVLDDPLLRPELTVIVAVYNKARYLPRCLSSLLNLTLAPHLLRVLCVDDASTDGSAAVVRRFQARDPRILLHRSARNVGTHEARIAAVLRVATPFLAFLDPDDVAAGAGLECALARIRRSALDIVEFACRRAFPPDNFTRIKCWKTPRASSATPRYFRHLFYTGRVNCHLHRKVFRSEVYRRAIEAMPPFVRGVRLLRYEDKLQFAFIVEAMVGGWAFVPVLGEYKFDDLEDNSRSGAYQDGNQSRENDRFVSWAINRTFGRIAV